MQTLLSVEEVAHHLGIGRTTAYSLVHQIKHLKVGRRILIAEEDLLAYLDRAAKTDESTPNKNNKKTKKKETVS